MPELFEKIIEHVPGLLRVRLSKVDGESELTCSLTLVQAVRECLDADFSFHAKYVRNKG